MVEFFRTKLGEIIPPYGRLQFWGVIGMFPGKKGTEKWLRAVAAAQAAHRTSGDPLTRKRIEEVCKQAGIQLE